MIQVDAQTMREIAPHFSGANGERQNAIITAVGEALATTLAAYAIDTRLRIAHFLAQTCHESAGFRTTEEFASGEAYEGRDDLGTNQPGDGVRFKGRGLLQLTGRANYKNFGPLLGVDLVGLSRRRNVFLIPRILQSSSRWLVSTRSARQRGMAKLRQLPLQRVNRWGRLVVRKRLPEELGDERHVQSSHPR